MLEGKTALTADSVIRAGNNSGFAPADCKLKEYRNLMKITKRYTFPICDQPLRHELHTFTFWVTAVRVDIRIVW